MAAYTQAKKIGLLLALIPFICFGQNPQTEGNGIRVMFYNVENLFHPTDDSLKRDDEFTPEGERHWNFYRYQLKLNKIGKTILAAGEFDPPAIVGLCEIENLDCLKGLIYDSPIKKYGYEIAHFESPDKRGIDVAMLYRKELVSVIHQEALPVYVASDNYHSRDILYTQCLVGLDTLNFFVNHWPSRYGGQLKTEPFRKHAASILKCKIDSIRSNNPDQGIVAMGDFNDHPEDASLSENLGASMNPSKGNLQNLTSQMKTEIGTHKHDHLWGILDQFIVSRNLIDSSAAFHTSPDLVQIFNPSFLMEPEKDGIGDRPSRTYIGFNYNGGYSDHLPILIDLYFTRD